jgi:succinate dehydrogenase/fumarate reductase flavoprotein subunit
LGAKVNAAEGRFDDDYDVVIVGYGFAGAAAALAASGAGAKVLLVEKMADPGGISICSGGSARSAYNFEDAFAYLKASNADRTPDDILAVIARGMVEIPQYLEKLSTPFGMKITSTLTLNRKQGGNYPLPGWETFYHSFIDIIPDFEARTVYPQVRGMPGGARLFHVLELNVKKQDIDVWLESPARSLITRSNGHRNEVIGIVVDTPSGRRRVRARRAVVLACGGFECDEEMKQQFWQMMPVLPAMAKQNSGDGIRMTQSVGAGLWHMWHYHGSYGFRPPPDLFPYGIRMKRLPDWVPQADARARAVMCWILVDQSGRRFMNEMPPYTQDTGARPFEFFDPITQRFPRIPAHMICDEEGRKMYPLGMPCFNERGIEFRWSDDNLQEVQNGLLQRFNSLPELAAAIDVNELALRSTIDRWNESCDHDCDPEFGRPPGSLKSIRTPPYYTAKIWPIVSNTQGGPVHNVRQQVIDVTNNAIPRLYAAGELGSAFGHLYMSGSNITECFVTGNIAGRESASLSDWN